MGKKKDRSTWGEGLRIGATKTPDNPGQQSKATGTPADSGRSETARTYARDGDTIILTLTVDQFEGLLLAVGYVAGEAHADSDEHRFWRWMRLSNEINRGNPDYTPYEIPPDFQGIEAASAMPAKDDGPTPEDGG